MEEVVESDEIDLLIYVLQIICIEKLLLAAEKGKWVLTEKPLSLNVAEGEEMVAAVEKAGYQIWYGTIIEEFLLLH